MAKQIILKISRHLWYLSEETIGMAFFDDKISNDVKTKMVEKLRLNDPDDYSSETSTSSNDSDESDPDPQSEEEESDGAEDLEFSYEEDDDQLFEIDDSDQSDCEEESDISIRQNDEFNECPHRVFVNVGEIIKTFPKKNLSDFVTPMTKQFFQRFQIPCKFLESPPSTWIHDREYKESREIVSKLKVVNDTAERGIQQMSKYNNILSKDEKTQQFILHVVNFYNRKYKTANIKDLVQE